MDYITWGVLGAALGATIWLLCYVHYYLPQRLEERFVDSMKAFSTAIELRCPSHQGLSLRVVSLSLAVGRELELSDGQLKDLEMAARLRDIGLCAIPYALVNDKETPDWTEAESLTYNRHAEVSGAMLDLVPSLRHLAQTVRWHHSRYDGAGNDPTVPAGSNLPINSRILSVVTDYVWRDRWQGDLLARQVIRDGTGKTYCPQVTDALWVVLRSCRVAARERAIAV